MEVRSTTRFAIGDTPKRREDARLLSAASYLDDLAFDNLTHAALLRSPHAHARITHLDATTAHLPPCAGRSHQRRC